MLNVGEPCHASQAAAEQLRRAVYPASLKEE